jgi:hypothetical protein
MKRNLLSLIIIFGMFSAGYGQVAINSTGAEAEASSILDINSTDKGLLIPRVNITDVDSDMNPVENPAEGLLVYNVGEVEDIPQGFYFWSEAKWNRVTSGNQTFTTNQQGQMYEAAEMYENNDLSSPSTIDLVKATNYYGWVNASQGETFGTTTTDLEDVDADKIIVGEDGLYKIEIAVSLEATTNNFLLEVAVFHTPVSTGIAEATRTKFYRKMSALDIGSGSTHGLHRLQAGDAIDLRFKAETWGETLDVYNVDMIVNKVGEY